MVNISFDWTVLVQIANFLVLMLALNLILYKPLRRLMDSRRELMETLKGNADVARQQLAEGEAQQERFRGEVLQQGVGLHGRLKEEGQAREQEILSGSQLEAARRLDEARQAMSRAVEAARQDLRAQAQVLANELALKLLGRGQESAN
ncbi:MAG: ATP synthase F0 subunit B [Deltaproteobacteria bacterium]|jgi:F-type H+-transporting ATPase subunit b|nr:ATP synthase F0 subunit B [Deltaproteobacteria bacterium]